MPKFPGFHLVPASTWVVLPPEKQELLRSAGGFAVNDAFITLWDRPATEKRELLILYGTYGSSKTVDRIQEHILTCLTDKYFKCFYGREVFDLAKREFHSSIVSAIENMGLAHLFEYSKKPNGTKEIYCIANGNKFKPFGCDDEDSFKGWDDATHIMVDEMNQISFKSFGMLQSRLRKKGARKCFTGMFNNCDVYEDHWIRTTLLNPEAEMRDDKGNAIQRNIIEHFSLYTDNYFIDQEDYRNSLIEQAGNDPDRRQAILEGKWGAKTTGQPFYKNFNPRVHVGGCEYNPRLALHVSFDENVNPYLPCGIFQLDGNNLYMIDEIAAQNPCNTLRWVCNEIYKRYGPSGKDHKAGMIVYGDATSVKDDTKVEKGKNFFTVAKSYLEYFKPKLRVSKSNPNVAMRGNFINAVMMSNIHGLFITISPTCKHMIADFMHTAEAPDGSSKDKTKVTVDGVKGVQRWGHFTDLFDYIFIEAYMRYYLMFQAGGKKQSWVSGKRVPHNAF
jgi:hypothetical protein